METSRLWLWDLMVTTNPRFSTNPRKLNLSPRLLTAGERQGAARRRTQLQWPMLSTKTLCFRLKSFGEILMAKNRTLWCQIPRELDLRAWTDQIAECSGPTLWQDQRAILVTTQNSEMSSDQSSTKPWKGRHLLRTFTSWRSMMTSWEQLITIRVFSFQFATNIGQPSSPTLPVKIESQLDLRKQRARSKPTRRRATSS